MKTITPYLNFDGTTREVMTFYHQTLGGELSVQTFAESGSPSPPGAENRVIHARITTGAITLMASDSMVGMTHVVGTNFAVTIDCDDVAELERLFAGISAGGQVTMAPQDAFWGARFGMCTDKFGIQWMFHCNL